MVGRSSFKQEEIELEDDSPGNMVHPCIEQKKHAHMKDFVDISSVRTTVYIEVTASSLLLESGRILSTARGDQPGGVVGLGSGFRLCRRHVNARSLTGKGRLERAETID
jgi:hypothetical protein